MSDDAMHKYVADLLADSAAQKDTHLDLGGLELTEIPPPLTELTTLTHLSLRGNEITAIPASIGQLTQLAQLSLADNQLTQLPAELGQLSRLRSLNLKNNALTELPLELLDLKQLERLQLNGNPLGIPADLLAKYDRPQEILTYYRENCVVIPPPPPQPLHKRIAEQFTSSQLSDLIDDLCVPDGEIADTSPHEERALQLIAYHHTHGLESDFLDLLQVLRPGRFSSHN